MLDAVVPALEKAMRPSEPSARPGALALVAEAEPQPVGRPDRAQGVARVEVRVVRALERGEEVLVAPEQPLAERQPVEIVARKRLLPIGQRQCLGRLAPGPAPVVVAGQLEVLHREPRSLTSPGEGWSAALAAWRQGWFGAFGGSPGLATTALAGAYASVTPGTPS